MRLSSTTTTTATGTTTRTTGTGTTTRTTGTTKTTTGTTTTTTDTITITTTTCLFYPDDQGAVQVGKEALLRVHLGARAETQNLTSYSINQHWSL